ncbi:TPA: putative zinc ribbon protein [Raoultella planticola]|uniref:putative zinc ribbon protein n=1 Tax=Enterobacterales TaxID=91347 RepID=UPI000BA17DF7|nr:putative zinc ribbon protein [Raoultella planticola]NCB59345.1 hypothetical protein [Gammaproteobacteria bacterium]OZP73353.1 hypothetical protein CIG23_11825 [Raoultella planticola]HCU0768676.1 hypothetical protein [Klebsiella michiganensis]HDT6558386.1 hypothetical protein [Raoultella ornithinolytica]
MRILKCYLANNSNGRFVTAKEASSSTDTWTCASCDCTLILHSSETNAPWFEHDQSTVSINVLMNCTHLDPEVKNEVRRNKLRRFISRLDSTMTVQDWYCAWCGSHYKGEKLCIKCSTGIYSIEEACWQMNYS